MTTSHLPLDGLFAYDIGTSLAAPAVARQAATLWHTLRDYIGAEPQPNLVRAVLATASDIPEPLHDLLHPEHGDHGVRQVAGYGFIDDDFALDSADCRVTLVAQDRLSIDSFAIFEVPVPLEFRQAPGDKRIVVSLAFDPPVRRRRADYVGVRMDYSLIRGRSVEEIVDAYRALSTEERIAARSGDYAIQGAFQDASRCRLQPGPQALRTSTLQRSEITFKQRTQNYGDSWYLVVRANRVWAPAPITHQTFGIAIVLEADEPQLYNLVRQRIELRQQQRARARR